MKIALAHDSFTQLGGAERVLEALHEMFPEAPVFTLVFDPMLKEKYKNWDIRTSALQPLYAALGKFQYMLPLITYGVESFDFSGYDLVITSSSTFIKNIRLPKNTKHICYCHTPTRFLWSDPDYVKQEVPFGMRWFINLILKKLKKWDYLGAQRVTKFIANSKEVQSRIKKYYNRDSEIVYPFVENKFWIDFPQPQGLANEEFPNQGPLKQNYFLLAGRLQPHKNNEMVVELFNELNLPLRVAGVGRQEQYLKSISKSNIEFLGKVSDSELIDQYKSAQGFIYPQVEDFGLMPLEAAACGTATIAKGQGGALETILPGVTGEFFNSTDELKNIIQKWDSNKYKISSLREQASKFSKEKFKDSILNIVNGF